MPSPNHPPTTTEAREQTAARRLGYLVSETLLTMLAAVVLHRLAHEAALHHQTLSGLGDRYGLVPFAEWALGWTGPVPEDRSCLLYTSRCV